MAGVLVLAYFLLAGAVLARGVFSGLARHARIYLGLCAGLIMMMWLPALFAFAFKFSLAAQLCGMGAAGLIAGAGAFFTRKREVNRAGDAAPIKLFLGLLVPLLAVSAYLQYTHTLQNIDGALYSGQSTYGDLCLHLGIATGLVDAPFPPDYTILPGALLGYPFLMDAMSATMLIFGSSLQTAFVVPGIVMMGLVYWGFMLMAWEMTGRRAGVVIAYLLMFLNGGLGFLYTFDQVFADSTALDQALNGYYQAPANLIGENVRWVNCLCDLLVPQRTLLAGWAVVIPAFYLLLRALRENDRRMFVILGVWAGLMPMIHTHSFMALGAISAGALAYCAVKKRELVKNILVYGAIAVVIALPQLLFWSFPQTTGGGFPKLRFNWVNTDQDGGMKDEYFWFWIKNMGLIFIIMAPAGLSAKWREKAIALGALILFVLAEFIQFQRNEYDNSKLFFVAYMIMLPVCANYLLIIWNKLQGVRGRALILAAFMLASLTSGAVSIARECRSHYQLFSQTDVALAEYVKENTDRDDLFLTGTQHNNPISALAGRYLVCGAGALYLYWHGIDYSLQDAAARDMLENPTLEKLMDYGVDYVMIGENERNGYAIDESWFVENCETAFSENGLALYKVAPLD